MRRGRSGETEAGKPDWERLCHGGDARPPLRERSREPGPSRPRGSEQGSLGRLIRASSATEQAAGRFSRISCPTSSPAGGSFVAVESALSGPFLFAASGAACCRRPWSSREKVLSVNTKPRRRTAHSPPPPVLRNSVPGTYHGPCGCLHTFMHRMGSAGSAHGALGRPQVFPFHGSFRCAVPRTAVCRRLPPAPSFRHARPFPLGRL